MTITYWPGLCWGLGGPGGAVVAGQPGLGGPQCGPHQITPTRSTRPAPLGMSASTGVNTTHFFFK